MIAVKNSDRHKKRLEDPENTFFLHLHGQKD
jgi:hypothetical protein